MTDLFNTVARKVCQATGSAWAFLIATLTVVVWAVTGPLFHFSETWQLVINTGTTIVTFLMVFLIQNAQNRDSQAMQLKLDELIRSSEGARNDLIDFENCTDEELEQMAKEFANLKMSSPRTQEIAESVSERLSKRRDK